MAFEHLLTDYLDALPLDNLVAWADLLGVRHDRDRWLDDDYPDKEEDLRTRVEHAVSLIGNQPDPNRPWKEEEYKL